MNDKTGRALAASIGELAKALSRLAAAHEKQLGYRGTYYMGGGGDPVTGTWTYPGHTGGGGSGGVGGSPGGVHPVGRSGGGGSGAGGAALTIVGSNVASPLTA